MASDAYPNLGFDPAPGDLETIRTLLRAVGTVVDDSDASHSELTKIGTSDGLWVGKAADKFTKGVEPIPPYLKKAVTSLSAARRALVQWESQLDGFKTRARKLEQEAAEAAGKVAGAQSAVDGLATSTEGMSDKEKDEHAKDSKSKKNALDSANNELEAVRGRAKALSSEHSTAAGDTARQIATAADDAPPEPGWFDEFVDSVGDFFGEVWETLSDPNFWKMIGDVLADLAMIVGFAALFISGIGGIAVALAVGALVMHGLAKWGGADVSWETLAWDAGGALAGGIGLLGSSLAKSGRLLVQSGRSLRMSSGVLATLGKVGPGNLKALAQLPSGVANSARGFAMAGKGWSFVAAGVAIDKSMGVLGGALAIGSNSHSGDWNSGRWTNNKHEVNDYPVVGPFLDYFGKVDEEDTTVIAPGETPGFDSSATLASSGESFTNHLDPSKVGMAA
ncbi:putative T7SS-secreted protein [Streptomyces sp. NPDC002851]